ncbi:fumarylacetoacetate hydrolase family protein [Streptomyces sp. GS7]|uniref:fumarylacetoacetate hydrolase family protein n=1 Tax=Streptomyces sp. GS7 TaxID=2692234 RepID=UPI0022A8C0B8|nr:fumarylacetoacetate hydrolase family protein [Streptomyces sp. GS7]
MTRSPRSPPDGRTAARHRWSRWPDDDDRQVCCRRPQEQPRQGGGLHDARRAEKASDGRFPADPQTVFDCWEEFTAWARTPATQEAERIPLEDHRLGTPVPRPRQVFAVGLNYADHIAESALDTPARPAVFAKYPTSPAGPYDTVEPPSAMVDWEVELVAVIGARAHRVRAEDAWRYVAGLTVGQDLSERRIQLQGPVRHPSSRSASRSPGSARPVRSWSRRASSPTPTT